MKKVIRTVAALMICAAMTLPVEAVATATATPAVSTDKPSGPGNNNRGRGGGGNGGGSHKHTGNNNRPGNMPGGNHGNQNNNRPGGTPGNNNRPGNGPGGNHGNQNNNRPGGTPGNNNRPGNGPGGNHGNPNDNRPGNPPGGNFGHNRPGNPGHGPGAPGWNRPAPGPGHGGPGSAPMPPYRPNMRPPRPWAPPVRPVGFRPAPGWRPFTTILGVTLGSTISFSLNALINGGYVVDSYGDNTIYLSNVPMLNLNWPQAVMHYNTGGGLMASEFIFSTPGYSMNRYNMTYSDLTINYGNPYSVQTTNEGVTASWWGPNGQFIQLSYQPGYGPDGLMRYYTTLSFGN